MRGAHPGEVARYTVIIENDGAQNSSATQMHASLPANAPYVFGSAAVVGGGTLSVGAGQVDWAGSVAAGGRVTVTYNVTLPLSSARS